MKRYLSATVAAVVAIGTAVTPIAASAQHRHGNHRDGVPDRREWNRDRDRDGRPDQWDRRDNRRDWQDGRHHRQSWRYYGGRYGYAGYDGRWRTGQRFGYWRDNRYVVSDYGRYGLPPPWRGYRYYRDSDGDIVMAAIATGVIGLIIGGALAY